MLAQELARSNSEPEREKASNFTGKKRDSDQAYDPMRCTVFIRTHDRLQKLLASEPAQVCSKPHTVIGGRALKCLEQAKRSVKQGRLLSLSIDSNRLC